jgi:hypothetical protein
MKVINIRQLIIIVLYILFSFTFLIFPQGSAKIQGLIVFLLFTPLFIKLIWLLADPKDNSLLFKENISESIEKGACPFCKSHKVNGDKLRVGYRKALWEIYYKVFFIEYSKDYLQLTATLPICFKCKNKYLFVSRYKILSLFTRNPSKKVLKRKISYLRGLKNPYGSWHLIKR